MDGYTMLEALLSRCIDQFVPAVNGFMHIGFGFLIAQYTLSKK